MHIYASHDQGESWAALAIVSGQYWSNLFIRDDGVYVLGTSSDGYAGEGSIAISRSTDSGVTWQRQVFCVNICADFCMHGAAYTQRGSTGFAKVSSVTPCMSACPADHRASPRRSNRQLCNGCHAAAGVERPPVAGAGAVGSPAQANCESSHHASTLPDPVITRTSRL